MSEVRLLLFGMPRLEKADKPIEIKRIKALALAAYLAMNNGRHSRVFLASLLWPDLDRERGLSALRSTLHALTQALPADWIAADRHALALNRDAAWVDAGEFMWLISENTRHGHGPDEPCEQCVAAFEQAVTLYSGDFLAGLDVADSLEFDDWQQMQRDWLRREQARLQHRLSDHYAALARHDRAISHALAWLAADTLHEPAYRQLMRLYEASGQRAEALRLYQHCARVLDEELITLPDEETTRLYEAIQQGSASPARSRPAQFSRQTGCVLPPLPTLTLGREMALEHVKARLGMRGGEQRPVTVIQGWPGVGKSTLVAALAHDPETAQHFPDGMLWTSLGENPGLVSELAIWANALLPAGDERGHSLDQMTVQLTALLKDRRVLLIVDDVWQAEHAHRFRVGGHQCALVLTSRLNDVAAALAPTADDMYRLPILSETSALDLLTRLTPETVAQYPAEARRLITDLERLPLAIQVAGRLLSSELAMGWGVRDLLEELRAGTALLEASPPSDLLGVGDNPSLTVAALLARSTDLLDDLPRERFALLGMFVPKPATFDLAAMAVAWDVGDPRPTARILVNRGLLEPIPGGQFQMHAVLVMHARSLLTTLREAG